MWRGGECAATFRVLEITQGESTISGGIGQPSLREERREREQALRRADVLSVASRVFAEKGFDGAQVGEIASRAEVSLATVYRLFDSKEELFHAVIDSTAGAIQQEVERRVAGVADPGERLLELIDGLYACFQENSDLLRIYARATHGLPWKIRQEMGESSLERFHGFSSIVADLAREAAREGRLEGLDPDAFALSLLGAVITTATHAVEEKPPQDPAHHAPAVRQLFARLVAGDPE